METSIIVTLLLVGSVINIVIAVVITSRSNKKMKKVLEGLKDL